MSYFVIKGPRGSSQYLCAPATFPEHKVPQWWFSRDKAVRFPDEESAWKWLDLVISMHPDGGQWTGRVVRVNTVRDWKAERAQLRSAIDSHRLHTDLKEGIIRLRDAEIERLSALLASDGTGKGGTP